MSTALAVATWKQNQINQHCFGAEENCFTISQTEHIQGSLIPDDSYLSLPCTAH